MTINMTVDQKHYPFLVQELLKLNCTAIRRKRQRSSSETSVYAIYLSSLRDDYEMNAHRTSLIRVCPNVQLENCWMNFDGM
jgi:hypothetical protein